MQSTPDQSIGKTSQKYHPTRRQFLQVVTAALGGAAIGAVAPEMNTSQPTEQQRLQSFGLGDYYPILQKYRLLRNTFQAAPGFTDNGIWSIEDTLESAARGDLSYKENQIEVLTKKVGSEKANAITHAHEFIEHLEIEGFDPHEVKQALHTLADVMPVAILAMSPNNKIIISGDQGGASHSNLMSLPSPVNRDKFYVSAIHELSHRLEANWMRYAQYIDKNRLINYWETTLDNVYRLTKIYLSLPWEQAMKFKFGNLLLISGANEDYLDYAEKLLGQYSQNPYTLGEIPKEHDIDDNSRKSYRYNKLTHHYGKLLLEWASKENLTDEERQLQFNISLAKIKSAVIGEFYHFFTGPIQKQEGSLPSHSSEVFDLSSPITIANLQIQQARLNAFSTLPIAAGVEDLYKGLKLDSNTPPTKK